MEYVTAVTDAEYKLEFEPTKYTPCLTLTGYGMYLFCKDFEGNWPHYNGTVPYVYKSSTVYLIKYAHGLVLSGFALYIFFCGEGPYDLYAIRFKVVLLVLGGSERSL